LYFIAVAYDQIQAPAAVDDGGVSTVPGMLFREIEAEALLKHAGRGD
jgi:hypothetical protein